MEIASLEHHSFEDADHCSNEMGESIFGQCEYLRCTENNVVVQTNCANIPSQDCDLTSTDANMHEFLSEVICRASTKVSQKILVRCTR